MKGNRQKRMQGWTLTGDLGVERDGKEEKADQGKVDKVQEEKEAHAGSVEALITNENVHMERYPKAQSQHQQGGPGTHGDQDNTLAQAQTNGAECIHSKAKARAKGREKVERGKEAKLARLDGNGKMVQFLWVR